MDKLDEIVGDEPSINNSEIKDATIEEIHPQPNDNGITVEEEAPITIFKNILTTPDVTKLTSDLQQARKDNEEIMEDRDSLFKILERRRLEIDRLENEMKVLRQQLKLSVESKCEAITKYDEIHHQMKQIEFKEKRFEQDRTLLEAQVETLSSDLNRNIFELQQSRKEATTHILSLESKLHEKTEELSISTRQLTQLKESNASLTSQVEDLSQKLFKFNEDYASTMHKYQQELKSKTRLSELYKEKNEDVMNEQKDITNIVTELRNALKEATDEFGKLETVSKHKEKQLEQEKEEMMKIITELQSELENIRKENIETSLEKLMNVSASRRLSGKSITEIFNLYVQSSIDLEALNVEHAQLKFNYDELVEEIKEKGPKIHKSQIEHERLKNAHESLKVQHEVLHRERLETHTEMEALVNEIQELRKSLVAAQEDRKDLSRQIRYLLEKKSRRESCDFITFDSIEELQDNNIRLVALVRDLSDAIEKMQNEQVNFINFFLINYLLI